MREKAGYQRPEQDKPAGVAGEMAALNQLSWVAALLILFAGCLMLAFPELEIWTVPLLISMGCLLNLIRGARNFLRKRWPLLAINAALICLTAGVLVWMLIRR